MIAVLNRRETPTISIKRRLVTSFVYLFLYLIIVSISMYAINKRIEQKFSNLSQHNENLWQVSGQLMLLQDSFQQTLRNNDAANLDRFAFQQEELDTLFNAIRRSDFKDLESQTLFRVLNTMHQYRIRSMDQLLDARLLSPSDHAEISFLSVQANDMNRIAQQLASHEQSLGNRTFSSFVNQESKRGVSILLVLIFFVIVFGILSIRSITRILGSTHQLIVEAKDIDGQGSYARTLVPSGYEEIDELASAYQRMRQEINDYITKLRGKADIEIALHKEQEENQRKDNLLKQAQLDLIRSQINPHFLFNTLNIIGKKVLLQDSEKSLELIENISQIMRYTLEHKEGSVSLAEELEIVESYLNIQKSRFGKRLSYHFDIQAQTETIMVPPVLLQPLVENCIKYGIEQEDTLLLITLSITSEGDLHVIHVLDNGPGFGEGSAACGHGMGIGNLHKRLALLYGNEALVTFSIPETGVGTDVCIKIPKDLS